MASWLIATWQEAVERSKNNYLSELVNTFRIERTILNSQEPPGPPDNLLVLVAHLADRENISICDFGGATGYVGQAVLSYVPNANYTVVENETLVALATRRLNTHVKFVTSIPAACDIFYCGGTLQFLEHPLEIWKQALSSTRLACILVRNSFSERAIICLMRANLFDNGHGAIPAGYRNQKVFYPHQTVPESAIIALANAHGFSLALRSPQNDGVSPYGNDVTGAQLVFLKNSHLQAGLVAVRATTE